MPVTVTSFFVKANPIIPFLLQDSDLRGGMRVVPDTSYFLPISQNRDAIPMGARVPGMLAVAQDTMRIYQLSKDGVFEDKGALGASSSIKNINAPFYLDQDGNLSIEEGTLLPTEGNPGDTLRLDQDRKPIWRATEANPGVGIRDTISHTAPYAIAPGVHYDFSMMMGRTNLIIEVRTDVPQIEIQAFGDASYGERNPYTFKSRPDQLYDDGTRLMSDGSIQYSRRFSFVANTEDPVSEVIYWRFTNHSNMPVVPTVTITYTAIE